MTRYGFPLFCQEHEYFKMTYTAGERNNAYSRHLDHPLEHMTPDQRREWIALNNRTAEACLNSEFTKPRFPVELDVDPEFLTLSAVKRMYQRLIDRK